MIVVYCLCKHQHDDSGSVAHQWSYKIAFFVHGSLFIVGAKTFLSSEVFSLQDCMFSSPFHICGRSSKVSFFA